MKYLKFFTTGISLIAAASLTNAQKIPTVNQPIPDGSENVIAPVVPPPYPIPNSSGNREIIGDTLTIGTTWYENQHTGTIGRMVAKDELGYLHFVWMNGLEEQAINRHVYYNYIDPSGIQGWPYTGYAVESSVRAGYTTMDVDYGGIAFPAFHQQTTGANFHTAVACDFFPHSGAFLVFEPDWLYDPAIPPPSDMELIWPRIQFDRNQAIHVIATENPWTGQAGGPQRQYYTQGTYDPGTFTITFPTSPDSTWQEISWTMTIAADLATSEVSDRVAFAWTYCRDDGFPGGDPSQRNNDIYYLIDEDGVDPNFEEAINLTQFIPPDLSLLPDTTAANMDTLRAYTDMSLFVDQNDWLHVAFTTPSYFEIQGTTYWHPSIIWHWSEQFPNEFRIIHNAFDDWWWNYTSCGAWNVKAQRPSLGQDPTTGYLYCVYQVYDCDTTALSAAGYPSGEVYVSVSIDGGFNWSVGTNITHTVTPSNALPGQCLSEICPTMAKVVDDYCHIIYVLDRDAGNVVQGEGSWTLNNVIYHKVLTNLIPTTPFVSQDVPFHVGSTIPETITVSPNTLLFGETPVYPLVLPSLPFNVTYYGPDSAFVYEVISSSPNFTTDFPGSGLIIYPGISFEVMVSFIPDEVMDYVCSLKVCTDQDTATVYAYGSGINPLDVELNLIGPQVIPATGGTLYYEVELDNLSTRPFVTEFWMNIELPNGVQFPVLGPIELSIPGVTSLSRFREQTVPGSAPPGSYAMYAIIGDYPWNVSDLDTLQFSKQGNDDFIHQEINPADWPNTGESFDDWFPAGDEAAKPGVYSLEPNYPNPFNPLTTISFALPQASHVKLTIYDLMGRQVALLVNGNRDAGAHEVTWDASIIASGLYFYRIEAGDFTSVRKMVLVK